MATVNISEQRVDIARYHSRDDITAELISQATAGQLDWQHVAHMLASSLQQVHHSLSFNAVYDYSSQAWIDAGK